MRVLANASIDRILTGLRAALNLAAAKDRDRVKNKAAWDGGLEAISESIPARKAVLADDKVSAFVREAYAIDERFGLFIDVCAQTGCRMSQAARLIVDDLDMGDPERPQLHMPRSAKGGKKRRKARAATKYGTQIDAALGARLQAHVAGRPETALLLLRAFGSRGS